MLDLSTYTGLPIQFDSKKNKLILNIEELICINENHIHLNDIKPTLLNKILVYPEYIYTEYRKIFNKQQENVFKKTGINHNLLVIPPNLLGIEYSKTHCYTSPLKETNKFATIIECCYGVMTVVLQVRKPRIEGETEVFEVGMVKAKKGERVLIPTGYDYVISNTRSQICLVSKLFVKDFRLDYRTMKNEQGLSYYVIRKNARQEVVVNPKYKNTPNIKKFKPQVLMEKHKLSHEFPLYMEFIKTPSKFAKLLEAFV